MSSPKVLRCFFQNNILAPSPLILMTFLGACDVLIPHMVNWRCLLRYFFQDIKFLVFPSCYPDKDARLIHVRTSGSSVQHVSYSPGNSISFPGTSKTKLPRSSIWCERRVHENSPLSILCAVVSWCLVTGVFLSWPSA